MNIKDPPITRFQKAPKGLPSSFYDPKCFNLKLPSQRKNLENIGNVAFLKDPTDSHAFKDIDEKLGNKSFTKSNWDSVTRKYNLDFPIQPESDSD
ncbi:hypothetical protein O181_048804 [Austropuccinia psidii MF-1]|uniref:Uncharacterized protein n=1 Tax=Austropuccinia psidii MF-1 TaxID=1389203 RepID=A0A9Q3DTK3_9BASI|nr:hypothetical protein [Austropuccinia psidii MF-1]